MNDANAVYGRCACGDLLTLDHLTKHCSLRVALPPLPRVERMHLEWLKQALAQRYDTEHVAVRGEN